MQHIQLGAASEAWECWRERRKVDAAVIWIAKGGVEVGVGAGASQFESECGVLHRHGQELGCHEVRRGLHLRRRRGHRHQADEHCQHALKVCKRGGCRHSERDRGACTESQQGMKRGQEL